MTVTIESLPGGRYAVSFDYDPQIIGLLRAAVPGYARRWDDDDRAWIVDAVYPLRCFIEALRYRGHDVDGDPPEMPACRECGAALSTYNIVGLCRECRLAATNARLSGRPADFTAAVTANEAIRNVAAILGGRPIKTTAADDGGEKE
jgi:hypothetical protein